MSETATDASVRVTGVDFAIVPVKDFERAKGFYGETLGLEFSKSWGDMPAAEYETGTLTLAVADMSAFGQSNEPNTGAIALRVDDVESARSALEEKGVTFHADTMDSGVCHMAFFSDPDGNPFMLHNRYAPPGAAP